jgi:general transcription factor 3C polypeptide 5 (transcription factor C subunit 1)
MLTRFDLDYEMEETSPSAVSRPLPQIPFYSIEYPGYVSSNSIPRAIHSVGGQAVIDNAFKRNASRTESLLELNLRPGNPFSHPVPGDVCPTSNVLMKVVKRKRRIVDAQSELEGEYTAEVVGVIPKTARFRSKDFLFVVALGDSALQAWLIINFSLI